MNTTLIPTDVIMSSDVEEFVRKNPWRGCDHLVVRIDRMAVHRMWVCSKCGTFLMSEVECLNNRKPYAGVDVAAAIKEHLKTSTLVRYRGSCHMEEVSPELYEKLRGQSLIDVLRFAPEISHSSHYEDSMRYAGFANYGASTANAKEFADAIYRRRKDR